MGMQDFREGEEENRTKTIKFSRALKGNFYHLPLNGNNTPILQL